jgi:hypothetical protein
MKTLLIQLQALEVELHHPGVRCNRQRLEVLLHPEFHEVGRSGRAYSLETVINFLASQEVQPVVVSDNFNVSELAAGVALLTYRSAHIGPDKILTHHTLRSSVWVQIGVGWQLRYHQGTAGAQTW